MQTQTVPAPSYQQDPAQPGQAAPQPVALGPIAKQLLALLAQLLLAWLGSIKFPPAPTPTPPSPSGYDPGTRQRCG